MDKWKLGLICAFGLIIGGIDMTLEAISGTETIASYVDKLFIGIGFVFFGTFLGWVSLKKRKKEKTGELLK